MGKFNLPFPIYCTGCQQVYSRNTLFEEAEYSGNFVKIICKRCQEFFLFLASDNWDSYKVYVGAVKLNDLQWYLRAISQLQEADEQIEEDIEEDEGDEEPEVVQEGDANEEEGVDEEEDANEEEPGGGVVEEVDSNEEEGVVEEEYANEEEPGGVVVEKENANEEEPYVGGGHVPKGVGMTWYYVQRIDDLEILVGHKSLNLNRLEAQRNDLNSTVRMLNEENQEIQLLQGLRRW